MGSEPLIAGIDVGSTTVKAMVSAEGSDEILWSDYQRHETKQAEKVLEFLQRIDRDLDGVGRRLRIFMTGSGGGPLASRIGAKFVQEVNAVSLAVEKHHPEVGSVIELGGQDAKIVIWQTDPKNGGRRKLASMNDKCAGGTGAVIDKICAKLQLKPESLRTLLYDGVKLHQVAGKCGVFAETDINGLQKQGVPASELMASLFEAIVQQNLTVLTRGNTLLPTVLLLGGPNTFIPAMVEAWRANIPKIWEERGTLGDREGHPADLITVPKNAEYYAALGCILYGLEEGAEIGEFKGVAELEEFINKGRLGGLSSEADEPLAASPDEVAAFYGTFASKVVDKPHFLPGQKVEAWLGIDGGSTSTKGVLIDRAGDLIVARYCLSQGNPIADAKEILAGLREDVECDGAKLEIKGFGTTGYAKDVLKGTLGADVALVETVAHAKSALRYHDDVDVIVDVGGQDIKVIFVSDGNVKDFKLNTQCSAGNGYFLQNTAERFGIPVEEYAEHAFTAEAAPSFSYGCAVFMESDIVNFQRRGWQKEEIMAGLARVLPKNIWLYVVQEPNLKKFGTRFVLQGGTQRNLAAVKAQIDYIKERVPEAQVTVHRYCGESGAIGCALEALRLTGSGPTDFIGFEDTASLSFVATRDESTRCYSCANNCLRTFIDTKSHSGRSNRFVAATCEKGEAVDESAAKDVRKDLALRARANPDLVGYSAARVFKTYRPERVARPDANWSLGNVVKSLARKTALGAGRAAAKRSPSGRGFADVLRHRASLVVGMPRVLNMYSLAPFFRSYFEALGIESIRWSDFTSEALWKAGGKRGSIDQCFPSKVAVAHVHNLLYPPREREKVDILFFPALITLTDPLAHTVDSCACPTVQSVSNVCKAAFTKESDLFASQGIELVDCALHFKEPKFLEAELFEAFRDLLDLGREENALAVTEAWKALGRCKEDMVERGRRVLRGLVDERRVGILMLGRPYHSDPGLNHGIMQELQKLGYPIFSMDSLPDSDEELVELFGPDLEAGLIEHPKDIRDVFGNAYSTNSSYKIWAAKYAARHPNIAVLDLSNFKCGHDAPIYHIIEGILRATHTPYFTLHDIDENKPAGSIKIRVDTMVYALRRYEESLRTGQHGAKLGEAIEFPMNLSADAEPVISGASSAARKLDLLQISTGATSDG